MSRKAIDWYDTPYYYDIIFDEDTHKEADFLEAVFQKHSGIKKTGAVLDILEPACGSGRLVAALAERGHHVAGFDLNENMLAFTAERLKSHKLKAQLWQDKMEGFELPKAGLFHLAHCLVSTFKYVLTAEGATAHLQHIADSLRSGGLYVLGFHLSDYTDTKPQHERWVGERDGTHVVCNTHTWPPDPVTRTEKLRTRLRITRDGVEQTQETHWQFRTYDVPQVRQLLATVPDMELVGCYDFLYDLDDPRELAEGLYDMVLVLRKKAV